MYILPASSIVAVVWTLVLPRLERYETIESHIELMKNGGIDPSALYYTEHPSGRDWDRDMTLRVADNKRLFWTVPWLK